MAANRTLMKNIEFDRRPSPLSLDSDEDFSVFFFSEHQRSSAVSRVRSLG